MNATPESHAVRSAGALAEHESLSEAVLVAALDAARDRAAALEAAVNRALADRDRAQQEVHLLTQLLAVRRGAEASLRSEDADSKPNAESAPPRRLSPHPSVQQAISELKSAGKPLHISELMRLLNERGVEIPGQGVQANLIAHMSRHPEIVRPSRGMYALREWGVEDARPIKKAARKRVKGPSKGRSAGGHE
jgi:hypothetical protein